MIRKGLYKRIVMGGLVSASLLLATGCIEGFAAAGGLGFLLGRLSAPTTTIQECFLNGQPVECSNLP